MSWYAHDRHISASVTQRHGPVSKDDCVEIFISPNPEKVKNYYTFEINAIGTMLNRARTDWWSGPPTWEPEGVQYRTTFQGLPRERRIAAGHALDRRGGDSAEELRAGRRAHSAARWRRWRLNLQRLGGITNAQSSTWAPLPEGVRSFHTPEAFGSCDSSIRPPQAPPAAREHRHPPKPFSRAAIFTTGPAQCAMVRTGPRAIGAPRSPRVEDICARANRNCSMRSSRELRAR